MKVCNQVCLGKDRMSRDQKKSKRLTPIKILERNQLKRYVDEWNDKLPPGEPLDLNHLDVSRLRDFRFIFSQIKRPLRVESWDVSNALDMRAMFEGFEGSCNLGNWKVSKVHCFNHMFNDAKWSHPLDLSKWDVSGAKTMIAMFMGMSLPEQAGLTVGSWDVSRVIQMNFMFANVALPELDVSQWNPMNLLEADSMFQDSKIESFVSLERWNPVFLRRANFMFAGAAVVPKGLKEWRLPCLEVCSRMMFNTPFEESVLHWNIPESTTKHETFAQTAWETILGEVNPAYEKIVAYSREQYLKSALEGTNPEETTSKNKERPEQFEAKILKKRL